MSNRPKTDSWGHESEALEAGIRSMLRPAVRPPQSEQNLPAIHAPAMDKVIEDLSPEELSETPFWTNWEEHINDPEPKRASISLRKRPRPKGKTLNG